MFEACVRAWTTYSTGRPEPAVLARAAGAPRLWAPPSASAVEMPFPASSTAAGAKARCSARRAAGWRVDEAALQARPHLSAIVAATRRAPSLRVPIVARPHAAGAPSLGLRWRRVEGEEDDDADDAQQ